VNETQPICRKCKKQCEEQKNANPTWFGKYRNADLIEAICIECWKNGEKWENSSLKNK